jgi:hypothetical protein
LWFVMVCSLAQVTASDSPGRPPFTNL